MEVVVEIRQVKVVQINAVTQEKVMWNLGSGKGKVEVGLLKSSETEANLPKILTSPRKGEH